MIILFEFKKFFSEISNLIFLIALPIVLLFVLGKTSIGFNASEILSGIQIPDNSAVGAVVQTELKTVYNTMDYFGITMLMMMTFLSCLLGSNSYSEEYRLKTINRLFCVKYSRARIFAQKSIGLILIAFLEIAFFIIVVKGLFGISFALEKEEELAIILMAFINSILMLFAGSILGMIFKKNTLLLIMPLFCIMMLFGGTFTGNIYIDGVSEWMPIYQLQIAAFRAGTLHSYDLLHSVFLIEGVILICSIICAFIIFNRQNEVK